MPDIYRQLGVRPVINGNATLTRLGGSLMPPPVLAAMAEAAGAFVNLRELKRAVGREIARLTHNEAAYIACGAAAGMTLATAACVAGADPDLRERLPFTDGMKNEVIVHRHTRVGYDFAIRMAGVRLVEIGDPAGTTAADLEAALTERTAAMFYFPRGETERGELPLEQAVEICHARGVPVIVDGAAQIPPISNLWTYTQRGADLAIFSGGKGLRGPQSTGLVLGRRDLIEAMEFHGPPNPFIGRGMKVGKEELCGILAAVRWSLAQDEPAWLAQCEAMVAHVVDALRDVPGVRAVRAFPSEAGQPVARAQVFLDEARLRLTRDQVLAALLEGEPSIDLGEGPENSLYVNPQSLEPGEERVVTERLVALLTRASAR